jgi:hypothetical protein
MNIKLFKKLIKEAVAEAIYEELPELIEEALIKNQKQQLRENRTVNMTSANVPVGKLSGDVRSQLAAQLGESFGFTQTTPKLEVIDAVDEVTGEKVNPFLAFINDSASNMTPMDRQGLRNLD